MAELAGALEIQIFAELARLRDDMEKATGIVAKSGKSIESAANAARSALGALGLGISVVGFASLIKGSVDAMDKLNDLSKSTNLSVETLAGLKVAAKQSGGDLDSIAQSVNKLSVEMGKAPEKFRALGISATDKLEAFKQLADILNAIEDPQKRAAVAAVALGKGWAGAAPLLAEGSARIGEMVEAGTKASGITTEMAQQADKLNDQMALLETGIGGVTASLVSELMPSLIKTTVAMNEAQRSGASFWETMIAGWRQFATGDDMQKSSAELVGLTNSLLIAENELAASKAGGFKSDTDRHTQEVAAIKERIKLIQGYRTLLEAPAAVVKAGAGGGRGSASGAGADDFLGIGVAEREAAAKLVAKAIADARKAEMASREEAFKVGQDMAKVEMEGGAELAKLRAGWAAEDALIAADKTARSVSAVESIRVSLLTEQEVMAEHYNAQLEQLRLARELKTITDAEFNAYELALGDQHQAAMTALTERGYTERQKFAALSTKNQAKQVFGELANLSAGVAQHNRAMFELNKASGIAMAIINAYEGISLTMKTYPYPYNIAMAAAHGIAAFAQVKAIQSTSFGGSGGAAPSIAGSTPATPVTPVTSGVPGQSGGGQSTTIVLQGDTFGRKQVKALIEQINENTKDGGRVVLA